MNIKDEYLKKCHNELKNKYFCDGLIVKVTKQSVNGIAWFDEYIGKELIIYGVDLSSIPNIYLDADGDGIPFACAEISGSIVARNPEGYKERFELFAKKEGFGSQFTNM